MDSIIGQISTVVFSFAPRDWRNCGGQLIQIQQNTTLYSLLGVSFEGNGKTTFTLSDLRGREMVGQGSGPSITNIQVGQTGGTEHTTLTIGNLLTHTYNVSVEVSTANGEETVSTGKLAASANSFSEDVTAGSKLGGVFEQPVGSNKSLPIRKPYLAVNYSIALEGVFLSRN